MCSSAKMLKRLMELRRAAPEMEEKLGRMNRTHLQEISNNCGKQRPKADGVRHILVLAESSSVAFYEPFHFVSDEIRGSCPCTIKETLKAKF